MIKLRELEQTCYACPSQWEGLTHDGKRFYARYRWGILTASLDGNEFYSRDMGDGIGGVMDTEEMLSFLKITEVGKIKEYTEEFDIVSALDEIKRKKQKWE